MWFRPLSITLVVKRTRTGWQVSIRVQFTNQDWGRAKSSSLLQDQYSNSRPSPLLLQYLLDINQVRPYAQDIEPHRGQVVRQQPAALAAIGNNPRFDVQR